MYCVRGFHRRGEVRSPESTSSVCPKRIMHGSRGKRGDTRHNFSASTVTTAQKQGETKRGGIKMKTYYHFVILTTLREEESHIWILRSFTNAQDDMTI